MLPFSKELLPQWPGLDGLGYAVNARGSQATFLEVVVTMLPNKNVLQKQLPENNWKKGKDPHPQDKIQHLDFTKDPRPLYYKTPPCVFYHKNVRSEAKAVFGP